MKLKKLLICILFYGSPVLSQVIPAEVLNNTRTFEVSACKSSKNKIIAVWMERRPARRDNSEEAKDMQVGYKLSTNNGKTWTEKKVIDIPNTFATGNPYVTCNEKGNVYLVVMHIGNRFFVSDVLG